jgi:hypothetical protein
MTISEATKAHSVASALMAVLLFVSGCSHATPWRFDDETRQRLDRIENSDYRFDAVWTDFNGDGCPDPFIFGHADPATSRLWLNRCDGSNTFTLAPNDQVHYYIPEPASPMGAGWMTLLDVNGDGRQDFWLRHASVPAARYINGSKAGSHLPFFARKEDGCDDYCSFGDIDGDDVLDVIRKNRRIERIGDRSELYPAAGTPGVHFIGDIDGDGWPEILQPDAHGYWRNTHGKLVWQAVPGLRGDSELYALADLDNAGAMDLITFDGDDNSGAGGVHLYRNDGHGGLTDVTEGSGLDKIRYVPWLTGYGNIIAADFDNDGLPDLLFAGIDYSSSVTLMRNLGNLHFERVPIGFGSAGRGRDASKARAAVADFDNDGRLDILKTQDGSNAGIWRNNSDTAGAHWMKARVRGAGANTDGIGADLRWFRHGSTEQITHAMVQANSQHAQTWLHVGLAANSVVDLVVRFPHGGPSYRYDNLAVDQEVIAYADGCLVQHWLPGKGWDLKAPRDCAAHSKQASAAPLRSRAHRTCATKPAATPAATQRIELHRNGGKGDTAAVTFGIPFAPAQLTDAKQLRILDEHGNEIPAHIEPTLRWHFKDGSIRAVQAQVRVPLKGDSATLYFDTSQPRTKDAPGWPYAEGLVAGDGGIEVPGVVATLSPVWMSESLIAGPQEPSSATDAYGKYVATQFEWAQKLPTKEAAAWLFDRTSTLFKQYVRTGRADYLEAAIASYRFYMKHLRRWGPPIHPLCGGGWEFGKTNPCDIKYIYIEPILLALGLAGDNSQHDDALVERMAGSWESGGDSGIDGGYTKVDAHFTERVAGLGLIATVSAYEITGEARFKTDIDKRIGWLREHQQNNPDGLPADGSWRHSWQVHEGDTYDAATDIRGASPWMSENIVDGLWHAWLVTNDPRIPPMLTAFGRWLERYGWIDVPKFAKLGHDWRHDDCGGPNAQIAWYFSSPQASDEQLIKIQDSEGWYSDEHTVELALAVALARYFETDPAEQKALDRRLALIPNSYAPECARRSGTARRFNWNNRGSGAVQWLLRHFPAPSAPASTKGSAQ